MQTLVRAAATIGALLTRRALNADDLTRLGVACVRCKTNTPPVPAYAARRKLWSLTPFRWSASETFRVGTFFNRDYAEFSAGVDKGDSVGCFSYKSRSQV